MTDELVTVYTSQGHMRAEVIKSMLESQGIPAILRYDAVSRIYGITVNGIGRVQVQVRPEDADTACELIAAEPDIAGADDTFCEEGEDVDQDET